MNPEHAKIALERGADLLEKLNIRYWIGTGTLLGAYRDGFSDEFVTMDSDIDVFTLDESAWFKVLHAAAVDDYPWQYAQLFSMPDRWWKLTLATSNADGCVGFDLWLFKIGGRENWRTARCNLWAGAQIIPAYLVEDPLGEIEIYGRKYPPVVLFH